MAGFKLNAKPLPPVDIKSAYSKDMPEEESLPEDESIPKDRTKLINLANKTSLSGNVPSKSPTSMEQRMNVQKTDSSPQQYDLSLRQMFLDHADTKALIRKYGPKLTEPMLDEYRSLLEKEQGGDQDAKQKRREFVKSLENS